MPMGSPSHPTVLITGASRGLGLSIAQLLLSGGKTTSSGTPFPAANVVTLSRTLTPELKSLSQVPGEGRTTRLLAMQGDVSDEAANKRAVEAAVSEFGSLDAVILNAGVIEFARLADVSPASFAKQIEVNLVSLVTTLHFAIPHLRRARGVGRVIFVSSGASVGNMASWGAYNASKAGLNSLARTLANEEKQLAVWSVRPGVVATDMQLQIRESGAGSMDPEAHKKFVGMHEKEQLLSGEQPGSSIAALATAGTRQNPVDSDGTPLGEQGSFVNWDALRWT